MLTRFFSAVETLANGKAIALLAVLFILFTFVVFPAARAKRDEQANTVCSLDVLFSYTPEAAYRILDDCREQGRQWYMLIELTLDLVYPITNALLLGSLMIYGFRRAFPGNALLYRLTRLPFVYLLADYSENVGVLVLLANYPNKLLALAQMTGTFTMLKWVLAGVCMALALPGLFTLLLNSIRRGQQ